MMNLESRLFCLFAVHQCESLFDDLQNVFVSIRLLVQCSRNLIFES